MIVSPNQSNTMAGELKGILTVRARRIHTRLPPIAALGTEKGDKSTIITRLMRRPLESCSSQKSIDQC